MRGTIPDMFSDSDKFIAVQNVYKSKAKLDVDSVMSRVERLLLNINKPFDYINEERVKLYCEIIFNYFVILVFKRLILINIKVRIPTFWIWFDTGRWVTSTIRKFPRSILLLVWLIWIFLIFIWFKILYLDENSEGDLLIYLLIRAVDSFYTEYNRYPGSNGDILDSDVSLLKKVLNKLLSDNRVNIQIKEEYVHEM